MNAHRHAFSLMLLAVLLMIPTQAQAQYEAADDFNIAWSLDPRQSPDLFPRGPAFGARSVLVGMDLDQDGLKEILFTTDETLAPQGPDPGFLDVFLYEATGDDTYEYVWHYTHTDASNSLPALAYGDIDDDGLNEIYLGIPTLDDDNDLFIFEQGDDFVFPDAPTTTYGYERADTLDFRPSGFQVVDVDGDGQKELITTSRTGGNRELVVISPTGALDEFAAFAIEFEAGEDLLGGGGIYDVDVADFDGDGMNEIWVNTWDLFTMTVFEATGPDAYELQVEIDDAIDVNDPGSFNSHDLLFTDVDGDDRDELYLPMTDGKLYFLDDVDDVSTLTGDSFVAIGTFDTTASSRGGDLGDIDGDGLLDIVASHGTAEKVSWIEYDGSGAPTDSASYTWSLLIDSANDTLPDRYYPMQIADDLDGDGMNEVVLTNLFGTLEGQPIILVLEYTGEAATPNEGDIALPGDFVLDQNYPNPFNPSTTVEYVLPQSTQVSVRIYNTLGQVVRTLVRDQLLQAGRHQISWDGLSDARLQVPSGTYLYSLEYGTVRQTRQMTLIK